jgi:CRP-like cAMP-binding protein
MALLLPDGVRTARVRAESPIRCLAISRRDFDRILQEDPQIAVAMLPVLARRLADAQS